MVVSKGSMGLLDCIVAQIIIIEVWKLFRNWYVIIVIIIIRCTILDV